MTVPPAALWSTQFLDAQAVDLAHDEIEVGHALGPVLLGQIGLLVEVGDGGKQRVVGLEVESQALPHGTVVDGFLRHGSLL